MKYLIMLAFLLNNVLTYAQSVSKSKQWSLAINTGLGASNYNTQRDRLNFDTGRRNRAIFSQMLMLNIPFELYILQQMKRKLALGVGVGYFANRMYHSAWNRACGGSDTREEKGFIDFQWQYFTASVHGSWRFGKQDRWALTGALRNYFLPIAQNISEAKCFTCEANQPFIENMSKAAPSRFHTFELALGYKIPLSKNGRFYLLPKAGYEQLLLKSESEATPQGRFFTDVSVFYDLQKKK